MFAPKPSRYAVWLNYAIVAFSLALVGLGLRMLSGSGKDTAAAPDAVSFRYISQRDLGRASSAKEDVSSLEYIPESAMPVIAIPKLTEAPAAPGQPGPPPQFPAGAPAAAPPAVRPKPKFSLLPSVGAGKNASATSSAFYSLAQPEKKKEEKPAAAPATAPAAAPAPASSRRTFISITRPSGE